MELSNFKVLSVIGTGSFGTCYKVQDKFTKKIFAWKAIDYGDLKDSTKDSLISEVNFMRQLKHPNIVEYFDHIVNKETKTVYIVMECCEGGDLSQLISKCRLTHFRLEEKFIWRVLYQICKALQVCHNKISKGAVLHRDIKPANIFLDSEGNVKLGDFGLARFLQKNEDFADTFVGTPYYMSPEIIKSKKYDRKSDIWSVGCLIYEMSALRLPFKGSQFDQLSKTIAEGKFASIPEYYSSDLQDVICFMLNVNRECRPSIEVILRNPILVRNVPSSSKELTLLIPLPSAGFCQKLEFSPNKDMSSTSTSKLSTSGETSKFSTCKSKLYESIIDVCGGSLSKNHLETDPDVITQNIFNQALQGRLQAIRAQESLLRQKEADLDVRESDLNERERRLSALDKSLNQRKVRIDSLLKKVGLDTKNKRAKNIQKRIKCNDDSYCSIEPNETLLEPTVAKMDLAVMPRPKSFPRNVTFKSPQKFVKYDIENIPPKKELKCRGSTNTDKQIMKSSNSSKVSKESEANQKRKSILSIFGISNQKLDVKDKDSKKNSSVEVLNAVEPYNLAEIWTLQNKRTAFNMLAAMNAEEKKYEVCNSLSGASNRLNRNNQRRSVMVTSKERMLL